MKTRIATMVMVGVVALVLGGCNAEQTAPVHAEQTAPAKTIRTALSPKKTFQFEAPDMPGLLTADNFSAYASGHWISLSKNNSLPGPSAADINCYHEQSSCTEDRADITEWADDFNLRATHEEYQVEQWTEREILASYIDSGTCRMRNTLKIDVVEKRVYLIQRESEPQAGQDSPLSKITGPCNLNEIDLELRSFAMWKK